MKSPWIALIAVVVAAALADGILWHTSATRVTALQAQLDQSQADNARLQAQLSDASEKAQALESESAQLRAARALAGARLEPDASATPAPDDTPSKPKGNFFSQMFKDPQMRKLLAAQQANVLRGLYSDFLKQANLTPDETEKFFQLLQDRQMALMDSSANAMTGGKVDMNAATAATQASDDALKSLLGPDRYNTYEGYEKTLGVRVQLQQLNQQLSGEGMPLQDYQSTALTQIMSQENAATPTFTSGSSPQQIMNMTQAQIDQYSQRLDATNQRIYNQAMSVLTPPQLAAFQSFQKNTAAAQLAGIKMAQQMMNSNQ